MNAQTKEKLIVTGWKVFWVAMRVVLTGLTAIAVTLSLWNWSYSTRGYGAVGGEIILVPILALVTWWAIIVSHTAPAEIIRRMGYTPDVHDMELTGFLDWVMYEVDFNKWFFGHWHEDREIDDKFRAVYLDVIGL